MVERSGPGRWVTVRNPAGVLWESATGVGFQGAPNADAYAIEENIAEGFGFDDIAATFAPGTKITVGDLDHWKDERKPRVS